MKSMREQFDKELGERLRRYAEEPGKDFWTVIVSRPISVAPKSTTWTVHLSKAVIVIAATMFVSVDHFTFREEAGAQIASAPVQVSIDEAEVSTDQPGMLEMISDQKVTANKAKKARSEKWHSEEGVLSTDLQRMPFDRNASFSVLAAPRRGEDLVRSLFSDSAVTILQSSIIESLPQTSIAQKKLKHIWRKGSRFPLYLAVMPTFGYQRIESNDNDNILIESIRRVPAFSVDRLGVRLEVGAYAYLSSRWRAFGGVIYYQRKQTIDFVEKYMDALLIGSERGSNLTLEPQFSYRSKSLEHELKNLGLHFGVSYLLSEEKHRSKYRDAFSWNRMPGKWRMRFLHEVGAGIELQKSLNHASQLSGAEGFTNPSLYAFLNVYYRLQYPDKGRLRAILQPTLNYSFYMHKDINTPFYVKPYGLGLNFGCMYQL